MTAEGFAGAHKHPTPAAVDAATGEQDICGFCGEPGADKVPHPVRWPGERSAGTEYVHAECESEECGRAHAALSDSQRRDFLTEVVRYA